MKGYDAFFEEPGAVAELSCLVCGTKCTVMRDQMGPTGYIAAMARKSVLHDYFFCPHHEEPWHEQALELFMKMEESPSPRLKEIMRRDLEDLLRANLG